MTINISPEVFGTILGLLLERKEAFTKAKDRTNGLSLQIIEETLEAIDQSLLELQGEATDESQGLQEAILNDMHKFG